MKERVVNSNAVEMIRKTRGTASAGPKQIYGPPDRWNYFVWRREESCITLLLLRFGALQI